MTTPTSFPLVWPVQYPRTPDRDRKRPRWGTFSIKKGYAERQELTIAGARGRLQDELDLIKAADIILSTNVELRLDGQPRSAGSQPSDPGVALYFKLSGRSMALACDRWDTVAGNIAALAAHIGALRAMDRWGVGSVEQAFTGYAALPAPRTWWEVLDLEPDSTLAQIEAAYRYQARRAHPDAPGGSHDKMAEVNAAVQAARKARGA